MAILGYVSTAEVVAFMVKINPAFVTGDVNELVVNAMYHYINERVGTIYNASTPSTDTKLYIDGDGTKNAYCPNIPILSVTGIATVNEDGTETPFVTTGTGKNIWWDTSTGRIWTSIDENLELIERNCSGNFPDRPKSIMINGKFGGIVTDLLKLIQLSLVLKQYSLMTPGKYTTDIAGETIGKYSYKLANWESSSVAENQRKGLDGWIDFLFKQIPNDNSMGLEAI